MKSMDAMRAVVVGVAVVSASGVMAHAQDTASQDKMFLMNAAEGGMTEIQASQLALKKSKNADVKAYAQKMVDDHTMLIAQMKPFADQMGVVPPAKLKPEHMQEMSRLKAMSGDKFDKEYVTAMVADHHKDLGDFMTERDTTSNADLKATVAKGTDVIKEHTEMIDQMAQKDGIPTPPMPTSSTPTL
jgi:putative membrane protein